MRNGEIGWLYYVTWLGRLPWLRNIVGIYNRDILPDGWVIERGGVAFLMFVDSVLRFSMDFMFFRHVCVSFPLVFLAIFCAGQLNILNSDVLSAQDNSISGGSCYKVTVRPWFWHIKAVPFFLGRAGDTSLVTSVPSSSQSETWGNFRVWKRTCQQRSMTYVWKCKRTWQQRGMNVITSPHPTRKNSDNYTFGRPPVGIRTLRSYVPIVKTTFDWK